MQAPRMEGHRRIRSQTGTQLQRHTKSAQTGHLPEFVQFQRNGFPQHHSGTSRQDFFTLTTNLLIYAASFWVITTALLDLGSR